VSSTRWTPSLAASRRRQVTVGVRGAGHGLEVGEWLDVAGRARLEARARVTSAGSSGGNSELLQLYWSLGPGHPEPARAAGWGTGASPARDRPAGRVPGLAGLVAAQPALHAGAGRGVIAGHLWSSPSSPRSNSRGPATATVGAYSPPGFVLGRHHDQPTSITWTFRSTTCPPGSASSPAGSACALTIGHDEPREPQTCLGRRGSVSAGPEDLLVVQWAP